MHDLDLDLNKWPRSNSNLQIENPWLYKQDQLLPAGAVRVDANLLGQPLEMRSKVNECKQDEPIENV